jgi:hypothetical protein
VHARITEGNTYLAPFRRHGYLIGHDYAIEPGGVSDYIPGQTVEQGRRGQAQVTIPLILIGTKEAGAIVFNLSIVWRPLDMPAVAIPHQAGPDVLPMSPRLAHLYRPDEGIQSVSFAAGRLTQILDFRVL